MLSLCSVFDLPRLNEGPPADTLINVLSWIEAKPAAMPATVDGAPPIATVEDSDGQRPVIRIPNKDIAQYLTSIISSRLKWIENEEQKEQIWNLASKRLNERAGRTAMPERVRCYPILRRNRTWSNEKRWEIQLHEPTLTEDNLGLKTWTASYVLAQRLAHLAPPIRCAKRTISPQSSNVSNAAMGLKNDMAGNAALHPGTMSELTSQSIFEYVLSTPYGHVLELGAGTGLAGIVAALDYQTTVWCTDLPNIIPNLIRNAKSNEPLLGQRRGAIYCGVLDWNDPESIKVPGTNISINVRQPGVRFQIVLAADVLYDPQHAQQIAKAVSEWLERTEDARFIVALPKRPTSVIDWDKFTQALLEYGFTQVQQGEDVGYEDWVISEEETPPEVTIWWSSWAWTQPVLLNESSKTSNTFSE